MESRYLIALFLQVFLFQVNSFSIDKLLAKVEKDYETEMQGTDTGRSALSARPPWYDYKMDNRQSKNKENLVKLQYDMVMSKKMWYDIINSTKTLPHDRQKRNAVKFPELKWSKRISYEISEGFSERGELSIMKAMDYWEANTCLKFVDAKSTDLDLIDFVKSDGKCESYVGRMGGRQPINLQPITNTSDGCMTESILIHEIGHALGFFHEHMRADRDQYVKINYANIDEENHRQFDPLIRNDYLDFNKPYDYHSIMHYGKDVFSKNNRNTIEPYNSKYLDVIGNSKTLSYNDIKIANELYQCSEGCPEHILRTCKGFVGGSNCQCFCKYNDDPFDIRLCDTKAECQKPDIDMALYKIYRDIGFILKEVNLKKVSAFPHGLTYHLAPIEDCEFEPTNFTCVDGLWEGTLPECLPECELPQYDADRYKVSFDDQTVNGGFMVPSGDAVNVSCVHNSKGIDGELYCDNGLWNTSLEDIDCKSGTHERKLCSMVINATLTGSFEDGFQISCIDNYEIPSDIQVPVRFICNHRGLWEPFTPVCEPERCRMSRLKGKGKVLDVNGNSLHHGDVVKHGSDVRLVCPSGYLPSQESTYTCEFGKFTADIPSCTKVTCGPPPVINTHYTPRKSEYDINDRVRVTRCDGTDEFVGSRNLKCKASGEWSKAATCRPYCQGGNDTFIQKKDTIIARVKGVFSSTHPVDSSSTSPFDDCKKLCQSQSKYLCTGVEFGYSFTRTRFECTLYAVQETYLENKDNQRQAYRQTLAIRTCQRN